MRMFRFVVAMVSLSLLMPVASSAACSKSSGCKDCGWFPSRGALLCSTVTWDAYCTCEDDEQRGTCDLGTEECDYTGPEECVGIACPDQGGSNEERTLQAISPTDLSASLKSPPRAELDRQPGT